jgi:hypothetical protein
MGKRLGHRQQGRIVDYVRKALYELPIGSSTTIVGKPVFRAGPNWYQSHEGSLGGAGRELWQETLARHARFNPEVAVDIILPPGTRKG